MKYNLDLSLKNRCSCVILADRQAGVDMMVKEAYTAEQTNNELREAEILPNRGLTIGEAIKRFGGNRTKPSLAII